MALKGKGSNGSIKKFAKKAGGLSSQVVEKETSSGGELREEGQQLVARAEVLRIVNDADLQFAGEMLKSIKKAKKKVEEVLGPQVKSAYANWQTSLSQKKKFEAPLIKAEKLIKSTMSAYQIEQERKEEEERRRKEEEAAAKEAELKAEIEEQMEEAEEEGDEELVAILKEEAESVFVPVDVNTTTAIAKGITSQRDVKIEVTSTKDLLIAVINGDVKLSLDKLVNVKTSVIKAYVKATDTKKMPGVRITETKNQLVR